MRLREQPRWVLDLAKLLLELIVWIALCAVVIGAAAAKVTTINSEDGLTYNVIALAAAGVLLVAMFGLGYITAMRRSRTPDQRRNNWKTERPRREPRDWRAKAWALFWYFVIMGILVLLALIFGGSGDGTGV
jgi:hypothetical protein